MQQPATRAACAASTPLQLRFGVPAKNGWGPDPADVPDDPQPLIPEAPAAAFEQLARWRTSQEAAKAIIVADQLEGLYETLNGECEPFVKENVEDEIEVETLRYKKACNAFKKASRARCPSSYLSHRWLPSRTACRAPTGSGRLVRRLWELQLHCLGLYDHECLCEALRHARDEVLVASGVGWPGCHPEQHLRPVAVSMQNGLVAHVGE